VEYRALGRSGLMVSVLTMGTMTFGGKGGFAAVGATDVPEARRQVDQCLDAGVNIIDTADVYSDGESERIVGEVLGGLQGRRDDVLVATKVRMPMGPGPNDAGLSRQHVIAGCEASLRRLGVDHIDLYQLHEWDGVTPLQETFEALDLLVRSGKVRYVGYSNWPAWQAALAVATQKERGWTPFRVGQMYASLVGRDVEHETVPFMRAAGVGMMVWSPLAGGFLSGKYTRKDPTGGSGRLKDFDFLPTDKEQGWKVVDELAAIGKARGASVAAVALAWLLSKDWATTILVGASKMSQLDDNLKAADLQLSKDEVAALDAVTAPAPMYPNWFNEKTADGSTRQALGV
jgi:aryl-alcohol dehydrogenase-like predicted oxidoreductase